MKKIVGIIIIAVICLIGIYLSLPSSYFLRKALIHRLPKIDQYGIFENRLVRAGSPQPWILSEHYNKCHIPEKFLPIFEDLETVAFIVIKDSVLLFEQYWEDYSPQSHSNSFSMAKSIVSLAIGCAIEDGYIKGVDQPVSDFFPQFGEFDGVVMTIRHLLTMSAGVNFQEEYTSPFSPTTKIYYGNNLKKITFRMKQIEKPGVHFNYQSGVTQLLAFIVEKACNENISSYVSRKLWTPLNAEEDALWSLDKKDGMEKAYCCFNSNARDFARFGQLLLNHGLWNGSQLIDSTYLRDAITPDKNLIDREYNIVNTTYGYQFWFLTYKEMDIPYLRGILGQYVLTIPEKNAVVVRLGKERSDTRTEQHYPDDINTWLDAAFAIIDQAEQF